MVPESQELLLKKEAYGIQLLVTSNSFHSQKGELSQSEHSQSLARLLTWPFLTCPHFAELEQISTQECPVSPPRQLALPGCDIQLALLCRLLRPSGPVPRTRKSGAWLPTQGGSGWEPKLGTE